MIVLFAAYLLFSVGGLVLFKLGTSCTAVPFFERLLHLRLSWVSIGGCCCYVVSFLLYLLLVSRSELSILFPIATGVSCSLVLIASALILRETVSPLNWAGAAVIVIGILLVNLGRH